MARIWDIWSVSGWEYGDEDSTFDNTAAWQHRQARCRRRGTPGAAEPARWGMHLCKPITGGVTPRAKTSGTAEIWKFCGRFFWLRPSEGVRPPLWGDRPLRERLMTPALCIIARGDTPMGKSSGHRDYFEQGRMGCECADGPSECDRCWATGWAISQGILGMWSDLCGSDRCSLLSVDCCQREFELPVAWPVLIVHRLSLIVSLRSSELHCTCATRICALNLCCAA